MTSTFVLEEEEEHVKETGMGQGAPNTGVLCEGSWRGRMSPDWSDKSDTVFELSSMEVFGNLGEQSLGRVRMRLQATFGLADGK